MQETNFAEKNRQVCNWAEPATQSFNHWTHLVPGIGQLVSSVCVISSPDVIPSVSDHVHVVQVLLVNRGVVRVPT